MRRRGRFVLLLVLLVALGCVYFFGESLWEPIVLHLTGQRTVGDVVEAVGPAAVARLRPHFDAAGVSYPPGDVTLVGLKAEKRLELWARDERDATWRHVRDYVVLGASGVGGPKLREGDLQVPEGMYDLVALNANSRFYLSMKVDYPNAFDRARAAEDGRTGLGGDIFIHGKTASIGCLAMGDEAIEELFVLVAVVGLTRVRVIVAPQDLRVAPEVSVVGLPAWTEDLYNELGEVLRDFPVAEKTPPRD